VPVTELGGFVCAIFMGFPVPETISARGFVTLDYGPAPATDAVALSLFDSGCGTGNPGEPPPEQPLGTAVGTAGEILWPDRRPASGRVVSPAGCATPCDPTWSIPGADGDDPAGALASGAGDWVVVSWSTLSVIGGASHAAEWTGDLASVVHLAASGSILYAATSDGRVAAFPAGAAAPPPVRRPGRPRSAPGRPRSRSAATSSTWAATTAPSAPAGARLRGRHVRAAVVRRPRGGRDRATGHRPRDAPRALV
jgi:hypothetical protein